MMTFNDSGLSIIVDFEGCILTSYRDQKGVLTIGYGCTHHVVPGLTISHEEAIFRLREDIAETSKAVTNLLHPHELNDNQFSACICLAFNIGTGNFGKSTLLNCIKLGNINDAANEFTKWCKINGTESKGLLRRRNAERDLFLQSP